MSQKQLQATMIGVGAIYACMWAMFYTGSYTQISNNPQGVFSFATTLMLGIQVFAFCLFAFFKRIPPSLLLAVASLCTISLVAFFFVTPTHPELESVLLIASTLTFGIFRPLAIVCWFDFMCAMEYREVQSCSAASICLASALVLFLAAVNQPAANGIVSVLPIVSALAFLWGKSENGDGKEKARIAFEGFDDVVGCAKLIPISLLLEVLVVSVANGYIRGVDVFGEIEGTILIFSTVCICCAVIPFAKTLKSVYSASIVFVTVGLTLIAASRSALGYSLIAFGQIGISVIAWIACVAIAKKHGARSGIIGGFVWAVLTFGQVLGNIAGLLVTSSTAPDSSLESIIPMIIGVFSILLLALTINKPFLSIIYEEETLVKMDAAFSNKVAILVKQYGLTSREAEVFQMLAQGRNAKYITSRLNVSPNTTKTHIRNIYIKMGVGDHQELLSKFEA